MKKISIIAGIVLTIGTVGWGIGWGGAAMYSHFAKTSELEEVAAVQSIHIMSVQLSAIRRELWDLQKQFGPHCERAHPKIQERCRQLIQDEEHILRQLDERGQFRK